MHHAGYVPPAGRDIRAHVPLGKRDVLDLRQCCVSRVIVWLLGNFRNQFGVLHIAISADNYHCAAKEAFEGAVDDRSPVGFTELAAAKCGQVADMTQ